MPEAPTSLPLISLASGILPDCDGPTTARAAVAAGYRAVGLTVDPAIWTAATTRTVAEIVAAANIRVLDVEVVIIQPGQSTSPDWQCIIEAGAELGARNVLVVSNDPDIDNTKRAFEELCRLAEPSAMRVVLEFMMIFRINSLRTACEIVADVAHPAGGILIDALHLFRCGNTAEELRTLDPHLFPYMQLCDGPAQAAQKDVPGYLTDALDDRLAAGEGELPLTNLMDALPAGIPLSLEVRSRHYRNTYPDPGDRARAIRLQTERFMTDYLQ